MIGAVAVVMPVSALSAQTPEDFPEADKLPIALLIDMTSNQMLYARNPDRRFVPASVTKVMTLYSAFELIRDDRLSLDQRVTIGRETAREWGGKGSSMWLEAGDEVPVRDMLTGIATVSANDASIALGEEISGSVKAWTDFMTRTAHDIGMTQSRFGTPNGFPDEGATFTTASDLATLGAAMIRRHPQLYARFIGQKSFIYNEIEQRNRDPLLGKVEGHDGIKTGYTSEAGFTYLGSAKRGEQRLIVVIAGAERSSLRAQAARDLIEWGFDSFTQYALYSAGDRISTARVQNGDRRSVPLIAERDVRFNVPDGTRDNISLSIRYDGPVRAPIAAGEKIATLEISAPGVEPASMPLVAAEEVKQAGTFNRIVNAASRWWERTFG